MQGLRISLSLSIEMLLMVIQPWIKGADLVFQQKSALSYMVHKLLTENFQLSSFNMCPPNSPDLNPLNCCLFCLGDQSAAQQYQGVNEGNHNRHHNQKEQESHAVVWEPTWRFFSRLFYWIIFFSFSKVNIYRFFKMYSLFLLLNMFFVIICSQLPDASYMCIYK